MKNPEQFRELCRMQKAPDERIGVRMEGMNEVNFQRQETSYVKKDENDSKHI